MHYPRNVKFDLTGPYQYLCDGEKKMKRTYALSAKTKKLFLLQVTDQQVKRMKVHVAEEEVSSLHVDPRFQQALTVVREFNIHQLSALNELSALGLTAKLLRAFEGPEGFTDAHHKVLQYFMVQCAPALPATEAMQCIHGLNKKEVSDLKKRHENVHTVRNLDCGLA